MNDQKLPAAILALAAAHLVNDAFANIYAPLLPLFIPRIGLSLAAAGAIAMAFQVANSVGQMVVGPLADRWRMSAFALAGPFVAVVALSLVGLARSAPALAVMMVAGSLGNAAFHPASASLVHSAGGRRPGLAMSVHVTGGAVGTAIAPFIFAPYAEHLGLGWTPLLAVPALAVLALIGPFIPRESEAAGMSNTGPGALRPYAKPLALLWSVVVVRATVSLGFSTFLPVFLTARGMSVSNAGIVTGVYLLAGSIGGLGGGPAADRFGPRGVIAWTLLASVPLQVAAVGLDGSLAAVALAGGGLLLGSTLPVNVTYAHMIAPVATGTVSSLMLGVAWGAAGTAVPLIGLAADAIGLGPSLVFLALLPAPAAALTLLLPRLGGVPPEARPSAAARG
ncbi:MAG: MFS transporter [Vicinamibacterales bacterium]